MAFKDWTRFFKRAEPDRYAEGADDDHRSSPSAVESAAEEVAQEHQQAGRQALIKELEVGFHHVGQVVEQLDSHLGSTNRLLESVAAEQERLPALMNELTAAASASRQAHEALAQQLSQRDEANRQLLGHLSSLSESFDLERDQHRAQLALVMRLQRGGRRILVVLLLFSFLLIAMLMTLLLILALRPDIIGSDRIPNLLPSAPTESATEPNPEATSQRPADSPLAAAAQSSDPRIRATAEAILAQQNSAPSSP